MPTASEAARTLYLVRSVLKSTACCARDSGGSAPYT